MFLKIEIPNIFENPYIVIPQEINGESYYFEYFWNIRHEKLYLSIYLTDNDSQVYLVKNMCLTNLVEISRYIIHDRWTGGLWLKSNISGNYSDYNIKNISTNYYLFYNSEYVRS